MTEKRVMIGEEVLDEVLKRGTDAETVKLSHHIFGAAMQGSGAQAYVLDTMRLYSIPEAQTLRETYYNLGMHELGTINNELKGAKKFNIGDLSPEFIVQTGILGKQVLIGVDTSKEGVTTTSYYTRNSELIAELYRKGAFGEEYDTEKLEKDLKALDSRVANGIKKVTEEADATMMHGLAYARLDIARVEKGRVELKMVIRGTYRYDIGKTLKFYPYGVMPYLVGTLRKSVKDAPLKIIQREPDGTIKTRIVSFTTKAVKVAYTGYDANLVNSKIKKTKVGWDAIGISAKAHNLESSLYTIGYSKIRLDRVQKIQSVPLSDIDKTQHTVNYNNLKAHFQTCINRKWRTEDFLAFRGLDLKDQSTNGERKEVLMKWLNEVNDKELYDMMIAQPELFGDVLGSLGERERNLPKPFKAMEMIDLPEDNIEAAKELREMLNTGIVQVSMTTTKSTNIRTEVVTTNPILLRRMLGANYVENYESVGVKIRYLQNLVKAGKIESGEALQKKVYNMNLGEYIDVSTLDIDAYDAEVDRLQQPYTGGVGVVGSGGQIRAYDQALKVVESGLENVRPSNRTPNPYHVMVKRVYAETEKDYFATVDIRNVQSVEYAPLEK